MEKFQWLLLIIILSLLFKKDKHETIYGGKIFGLYGQQFESWRLLLGIRDLIFIPEVRS